MVAVNPSVPSRLIGVQIFRCDYDWISSHLCCQMNSAFFTLSIT